MYIYNNRSRFKFKHPTYANNRLITGKLSFIIKIFGSIDISIQISTNSKLITLLNITLISNFFINIISLYRFILKEVY